MKKNGSQDKEEMDANEAIDDKGKMFGNKE